LVALGDAVEVTHQYEDFMRQRMKIESDMDVEVPAGGLIEGVDEAARTVSNELPLGAGQYIKIIGSMLLDGHGSSTDGFVTGANMLLRITYQVFCEVPDGYVVGAAIFRSDDLYVCGLNTALDRYTINGQLGIHSIDLEYSRLPLLAGTYYFKMGVFDSTTKVRWDFLDRLCSFTVSSPYVADGVCILEHSWRQAV
jgi:hypothetical protein